MIDLIRNFFSSGALIPHGHCYLWKPGLVWLHVLSDSLIALAYYSIPLTLFYFVRKRQDLPFNWIFLLFATFITACGTTHLLEAWTLWHPVYWLSGTIKGGTAIVSFYTAMMMVSLVPQALALPSLTQIEVTNRELQREIIERQQTEALLWHSEAALQQSEARYRAIVEDQTELICRFLPDGTLTFVNHTYCRYFERTQAEVIQRSYLPVVLEEDLAKATGRLNGLSQADPVTIFTSQVLRPEGVRTQQWIAQAIVDPQGETIEFQAVGRDITEQKQVEERLQQSEERLNAIVTNISDGILVLNRDRVIHFANPAATRMLGQELPAQLLETPLGEVSAIEIRSSEGTLKFIELTLSAAEWMGEPVYIVALRDVTDRQRAETALRDSEERLQLALEASGDGLWDWNVATGELYYSPLYLEMLGYGRNELLQDLSAWEQLVHPDDMSQVQDLLETHLRDGSVPYKVEYRLRTRSGEWKWINAYGKVVVRDQQGRPLRMLGTTRDISDRKQVEQALQRYERIVSATTDSISLVDRNYVCQVVNQAYLSWNHKQHDEIVGHPVSDLLSQEVFETIVKPQLDQCLAGETIQYETWFEHFPTSPRFLSVTYAPYVDVDQTISGVVVSLRDLTRLKQAEKQLELQSIIVRNMAEGICLIRATDGVIVYTNPKFDRMFGYEPEELTGEYVAILNYEDVHTSTAEVAQNIMGEIIRYGESTYEVHNVKKDGTPFWCKATSSIFEHPEHGSVIVAVQQDITEQRQAQTQIQASLKEKEILLKEIHHRVKNNLQIIYSILRLQRRSLQDPRVAASLLDSQSRIESIALIHEKLYQTGNLAQVSFAEYIPGVVSNLVSSYDTYSQSIELEVEVERVFLDIDRAIPCGLLINELVSNSLKYAFPIHEIGHIKVSLQADENFHMTLIVQDDGIGLPEGFDITQAESLGLQLVQDFVDQLKGKMQMDCSNGTEFRITFPGGEL